MLQSDETVNRMEIQKALVKNIIQNTLLKIQNLQGEKQIIEDQIKILKLDIEDFKDGKLERMVERQLIDKESVDVSVVKIKKESVDSPAIPNYWQWPFIIKWNKNICETETLNTIPTDSNVLSNTSDPTETLVNTDNSDEIYYITCSIAKDATPGSYKIGEKIKHIR